MATSDLNSPLDGSERDESCAARSFGRPGHSAAWPRKLLDHFNLDDMRPAEIEFDTWLFGGPVLDFAVTQDSDALKVRTLRVSSLIALSISDGRHCSES